MQQPIGLSEEDYWARMRNEIDGPDSSWFTGRRIGHGGHTVIDRHFQFLHYGGMDWFTRTYYIIR
jgi:hypothetical protein